MQERMAKIKVGDALTADTDIGPVASVIWAKNSDEALFTANDTEFGLSAGVDYHVPLGRRKGSSYGPREQGNYAQENFTTVKTAYPLA